jgi:hypothetical protein
MDAIDAITDGDEAICAELGRIGTSGFADARGGAHPRPEADLERTGRCLAPLGVLK